MLEEFEKVCGVSRTIFEVISRKRLKKLVTKALVTPLKRAVKKIELPGGTSNDLLDAVSSAVDASMADFNSDTITPVILLCLAKSELKPSQYMTFINFLNDKAKIEQLIVALEKNATTIGRIVENTIVLAFQIRADLRAIEDE